MLVEAMDRSLAGRHQVESLGYDGKAGAEVLPVLFSLFGFCQSRFYRMSRRDHFSMMSGNPL
jgi:hypothetical protein